MSIEQALIAQAQPYMVGARLRSIIQQEISKGCRPDISRRTVSLEPRFEPIRTAENSLNTKKEPHWTAEAPTKSEDLIRLQVWISPEHKFDWNHSELFIKQLQAISFRAGFEVAGNCDGIVISFLIHHMAFEVENKANNDKAFYAAALRIAVVGGGKKARGLLSSLSTFISLFQHGGRPLGYLTEREYAGILQTAQIRDMFLLGLTYRPGFLVNSLELTGPIHIPSLSANDYRPIPITCLETLPVRNPELFTGTLIGSCVMQGSLKKHVSLWVCGGGIHILLGRQEWVRAQPRNT